MQVYKNFELRDILWYKIGGTAKYVIEVSSEQDIKEAFDFIFEKGIERYFIVGLGTNLLFTDDYFDGAVIRVSSSPSPLVEDGWGEEKRLRNSKIDGDKITAFAGVTLDSVIQTAFKNKLIGLSWAGGLPGTFGAAIRGNVGAFGGEIKDSTVEAKVLKIIDNSYNVATLNNEALNFSYRNSTIKQDRNLIVLSATLQLQETDSKGLEHAQQEYQKNIDYRKTHHPHDFPNTGSCFKNIKEPENVAKVLAVWPDIKKMSEEKWFGKISVGYVNRRLGFSGFKVGRAQVSEQHANFINNIGNAKANDVIAVIRTIQHRYKETFGFEPEPEVEIVE